MKSTRKISRLVFALAVMTLAVSSANEEIVSRIRREPVVSSNVASVGYSKSRRALEIEFTRGAIYRFLDVPTRVYREFLAADSKGHFIAEHIRGHFRYLRVRPRNQGRDATRLTPNDRSAH